MDDFRPDPDALLAQVQREESAEKHGRLYLFLGMCPGVGKTYAMLQLARQRMLDGVDVVAGVVETHGRSETQALLAGLDILPKRKLEHAGHLLEEFDLDRALKRKPGLLLVDELAHTNAPGSRHKKRYQDVLELLDAGIDVCSTLNVQHIDSQVDIVQQITGVAVAETVPDSILDRAHEIQLVDLSVEKLLERLAEGKVYLGDRAETAAQNFFREGNLTALRELALRFTAEQVDRDLEDIRRSRRVSSPWKTNARLMVGVAPTPYSESLIRWTRRAAGRLGCPWLAVWIEPSQPLDVQQQEYLTRALGLVRKLGGELVHATGDDVAATLLEVARDRNVSQIVVGKTSKRSRWKESLADQIIAGSGDIDVCIVRPVIGRLTSSAQGKEKLPGRKGGHEYAWVLGITLMLVTLCYGLLPYTGYILPALIFLMANMLTSLRLSRWPMLVMATLCALSWDYFFIPPQFTLHVNKPEDVLMLAMFFIVALSMGHLTTRLRKREQAERRRQMETDALLRVTQNAALSPEPGKGLRDALRIIEHVLDAETALIVREDGDGLLPVAHSASSYAPSPQEYAVASWAYANKQVAGRFTDTLPQSEAIWFPLQTATSIMGVVGLRFESSTARFDFVQRQAMEAFVLQLALVLEKEHFIQAFNQAELTEKSERLRRTLLDSVSHELKTPLAVIRAAIEGMGDHAGNPYVEEIATASKRLQRVVDGLLQMTRVEAQGIEPQREWCDMRDVVESAVSSAGDVMKSHALKIDLPDDLPLVKTDHALLTQALANILHNAAVYTPVKTSIEVITRVFDHKLLLMVRDHGTGLPDGEESKVFGKFYRAPGAPAGGTGLGLSIARGFVRSLGGDITARNHPGGGAVFEIVLQSEFLKEEVCSVPAT